MSKFKMPKIRVTTQKFKKHYSELASDDRKTLDSCVICKQSNGAEVEQVDERKLQWTISTGNVDRSSDIVDPKGWDFDNWIKGGSILWSHDPTTLPVAKPDKERPIWVDGDKVKSIAVYPDVGLNEFGHTVYRMAKGGFIRGASVGFISKEFEEAEDRDGFMPLNFNSQELLEWSHTPVPDNPQALMDAKGAGISLSPIKAWVSRVLDECVPIVGYSREELENTYAACDDKKSVSVDLSKSVSKTSDESPWIVKGVITYDQAHGGGTPTADKDADWDGPSEVAAADVDDLMVMSAWFDSDDAENKSAYKLPHHRAADKAVVETAVTNAIAVLNGARGGVDIPDGDRAGVYTHLSRHLREDFEVPNEEIPELRSVDLDNDSLPADANSEAADKDSVASIETRLSFVEGALVGLKESIADLKKTIESAKECQDALEEPTSSKAASPEERPSREEIAQIVRDALHTSGVLADIRKLGPALIPTETNH